MDADWTGIEFLAAHMAVLVATINLSFYIYAHAHTAWGRGFILGQFCAAGKLMAASITAYGPSAEIKTNVNSRRQLCGNYLSGLLNMPVHGRLMGQVQNNCEQNEAKFKTLGEIFRNRANWHMSESLTLVKRCTKAREMELAGRRDNAAKARSAISENAAELKSAPTQIEGGKGEEWHFSREEVRSPWFMILLLRLIPDYVRLGAGEWFRNDEGDYINGVRGVTIICDREKLDGARLYSIAHMSPRKMMALLMVDSNAIVTSAVAPKFPGWGSRVSTAAHGSLLRIGHASVALRTRGAHMLRCPRLPHIPTGRAAGLCGRVRRRGLGVLRVPPHVPRCCGPHAARGGPRAQAAGFRRGGQDTRAVDPGSGERGGRGPHCAR